METVTRAALDDNYKNQAAAQKVLIDRMLPINTFEKTVESRENIDFLISTIRPKKRVY